MRVDSACALSASQLSTVVDSDDGISLHPMPIHKNQVGVDVHRRGPHAPDQKCSVITPLAAVNRLSLGFCPVPVPHWGRGHRPQIMAKSKGKVFPYSLPSVGPGADPGVQAVSPQVT